MAAQLPGLHPDRALLAGLLHNIRCVAGVGVCRSISGTALPAFNKLRQAKRGAHAGIELLEQAQADNNVTTRLLNG